MSDVHARTHVRARGRPRVDNRRIHHKVKPSELGVEDQARCMRTRDVRGMRDAVEVDASWIVRNHTAWIYISAHVHLRSMALIGADM